MNWFPQKPRPFPTDPDVQLMLAFKDGDDAAFELLMRNHYRSVLNFIARFTGRPLVAEDLTQEVFLRIYRSRSRYAPKARFRTWMYTIARNLSLNELRRAATAGDWPGAIDADTRKGEALDPPDETTAAPETQLLSQERRKIVHRAIGALPENQRSAVLLRRFEDLSYAEIAAILDVSEKAVKSLLSRAKENLKTRLRHLVGD